MNVHSRRTLTTFVLASAICLSFVSVRAELVAHWNFDSVESDGTTASRVGPKALAGVFVGDARLEANVSDGVTTRASVLSLDGDGDWLQVNDGVTTLGDGHGFTIAAWIKTSHTSMALLGKDDVNGKFEAAEKIFFIHEGYSGRAVGFVGNSQEWIASRSVQVNDGRWRHLAITCDAAGGAQRVFVDGRDVTTETTYRAGPDRGEIVRIGASSWTDVACFRGHIDDVAVFDEALVPYQIVNVMRRGPASFDALPEGIELDALADLDPWEQLNRLAGAMERAGENFTGGASHSGADVQLGTWYVVGPLRHDEFGNVRDAFAHVFAPEADCVAAGSSAIELDKVYQATRFPGVRDTARPWVAKPDWVDGYRHQIARGPAPSRNETTYLYRLITVDRPTSLEMRLHAEDSIGVWLDGRKLGESHRADSQPSRFPSALSARLALTPGEHRLLLKITAIHGAHGFAFGIEGVTPMSPLRPGQWSPEIRNDAGTNFTLLDRPYFSEMETAKNDGEDDVAPDTLGACATELASQLAIPKPLVSRLPAFRSDIDGENTQLRLAQAQDLCRMARRRVAARGRVKGFAFDVTMTPMFDPPHSVMDEKLHAEHPPSRGGKAYMDRLAALRTEVDSTLRDSDVSSAAAAIEAMWSDQISVLPPIAFIRCPHFTVDARAPYSAAGATPAAICVFDPSRPHDRARVVFEESGTAIFDMNVSYDAKTIFFSAKRPGVAGGWQIYEIGVDGENLRQITNDSSDNISPCLLPSGEIMFVSTRAGYWVICAPRRAGLLYVCRRDGSGVRKVSANIDSDHTPQVMDDGRVLFTRWDYGVEKNVFARHGLWTMNPDGTSMRLFFGNTIEDPAGFWQARPVPGRPEVVCTFGPHHAYQAGMIGVLWNQLGTEAPRGEGFRFITNEIPSYCDVTFGHGYQDPFPLNERLTLVSYGGDGGRKTRLYLLDDRGNRKCIYEAAENLGCWSPLTLNPRPRPPVIAPQSDAREFVYRDPVEANQSPDESLTGTLLVHDVYQGLAPHVERGEAKFIQVMEQLPKTEMHLLDAWGTSPLVSRGTVHVRRLIGTAPIEADGSAHFIVPALRNISLNVLNAEGKLLMRMGSDMHVMPGERQSCIGCHENRQTAVAPGSWAKGSLAARREPSTPQRPDWGTDGIIDYARVVQPVMDRYCVECHEGATAAGGVDLSGDKTRFFNMSYDNLVERGLVNYHNVFGLDHDENTPKTLGSLVSRIGEYVDTSEHSGHEMPFEARQRIYTWIDANVPYYGTYCYSRPETTGSRDAWGMDQKMGGPEWILSTHETFQRRCMGCHQRKVYNPSLYGGPATVSSKLWTYRGITAHGFPGRFRMTALIGPELRINLTRPANSLMLTAPLSKEAGGLGLCRGEDGKPYIFADTSDPDYRAMLDAMEQGRAALEARPRADMPGFVPSR